MATAMPLHAAAQPALLSSAFITGSRAYAATDFVKLIGPHVGQPVSRELLERLQAEIQELYKSDGYVIPTVEASDSDLASGTPRLHIYEAQIAEVVLRGDCGPYCDVIRNGARLLASSVLHKQRIRASLRAIEQLPGVRLNAVFQPRMGETNRYTLILDTTYKAFQAGAYLHNRGTRDLGRTVVGGRTTFHGLLGMQESFTLRAATDHNVDNYSWVAGELSRRFASVATGLEISSSHIDTEWRYSNDRARLEIRTTAVDDGTSLVEPLLAIGVSNSEGREVASDYFATVRTRTIEAGVDARRTTTGSTTNFWAAVERGLDAFGAAVLTSEVTGYDFVFTKATFDGMHSYMIAPQWRVRVELDGQFSNDSLPPGERFAFGGSRFGRAFDPAALIGDSGAAGSFQLEYLRNWQSSFLHSGRVYVQADYGYSELNVSRQSANAASMTVGLSARFASFLASLELSQAVHGSRTDPDVSERRLFVYLQMSL